MFIKNLPISLLIALAVGSQLRATSDTPMTDYSEKYMVIEEKPDATAGVFTMKPLGKPTPVPPRHNQIGPWIPMVVSIYGNPLSLTMPLIAIPLHKRNGLNGQSGLQIGSFKQTIQEYGQDFATYLANSVGAVRAEFDVAFAQADAHKQLLEGADADALALEFSRMALSNIIMAKKSYKEKLFADARSQFINVIAYADRAIEQLWDVQNAPLFRDIAHDFYRQASRLNGRYPMDVAILKKALRYHSVISRVAAIQEAMQQVQALPQAMPPQINKVEERPTE